MISHVESGADEFVGVLQKPSATRRQRERTRTYLLLAVHLLQGLVASCAGIAQDRVRSRFDDEDQRLLFLVVQVERQGLDIRCDSPAERVGVLDGAERSASDGGRSVGPEVIGVSVGDGNEDFDEGAGERLLAVERIE